MTTLFILRHGQTEWNAEGRYQGHLNSELTSLGRYQAFQQGAILRAHGIDAPVFTSPLGRARDTALIATAHLKQELIPEPDLREITMGAFDGMTKLEIVNDYPDFDPYVKGWTAEAYGGEGHEDVYARARTILERIAQPAILVTHGVFSKYLRGLYLGLSHSDTLHLSQDQGCVYALGPGGQTVWMS
ncbi:MAG: histidine phosphatase family protein [Pseudomonadota bacterium]